MIQPKGILPALITPLTKNETLNVPVLRQMVNHTLAGGVHGIFAIGTTGEFYALSEKEYQDALEATLDEVAGRVPVYAGVNCITTRDAVRLTKIACAVGVDALSVLTPMFISPSDDQLYDHFKTIAAASTRPILLYNNPSRTGVSLSTALAARLADIDNIVGVKDSSGDLTQTCEYIRRTRGGNFHVFAGRDTLIYATLAYGGAGGVAACANVAPKICAEIYNRFVAGDHDGAREYQLRLAPLRIAFGFGTFPMVIKEALKLIGIDAGPCYAPVGEFTPAEREKLRAVLSEMELI